ncbi:MAG: ACP S-malonyltransferase [Acidimicrobiales bacterium]|nr:ACP S-malonyltransferase [Acidimicrobiales bacterium]
MLAFTFPGQGSQKPAMGAPWRDHPSWALVELAGEATGRDVAALLLDADAEELKLTHNAQLATFVLSMVVFDAVRRAGVGASHVAGHSLGEYSALVAAGAFDFATGARLVAERGAAMREASLERTGTMSAVLGLDDTLVDEACAEVRAGGGEVWLANANAPGQVVIAGSPEALELAAAAAKARGAKRVMPVAVTGAFHTPYMASAQTRLDAALATVAFADAVVPVATNTDAALHRAAGEWQALLSRQLCSPVRWRDLLGTLHADGVTIFVELGPGAVLTGMAKRTVDGTNTLSAATPQEVDALVRELATLSPDETPPTDGEHLFAAERLVVSPAAGVFSPAADLRDGHPVQAGDLLGRVGEHEVRSRFTGWLMGLLAHHGERVTSRQPVAWLRTS